MRALLVAACVWALSVSFAPARAQIVAPRAGELVTQSDLLGYLFVAPQPGDWLRYVVSVNGNEVVTKTVGFGAEELHQKQAAFFETQTQMPPLASVPVSMQPAVGGTIVWKMYVDAPDFDDSSRQYAFAGGIIKIGDSLFRLGGSPYSPSSAASAQSLQSMLLFGLLPMPDARYGTVVASQPQDVSVDGITLHTVHTTVDFSQNGMASAAGLPATQVETWQTSDVPLGLVTVRVTESGSVFSMDLVSFGRRSYQEQITQSIDAIPYFPGS